MKKTQDFNPCAYKAISNCGGIAIEVNNTGDAVRYQLSGGEPSRWCKISYTNYRAFFRIHGTRYYLDEFNNN